MTHLSKLLKPEHVVLEIKAVKKRAVIEELLAVLAGAGFVSKPAAYAAELLEREELASTGVGEGVAIPHRLSELVRETGMVFGRSAGGVDFDAVDGAPVRLIFLVAGRPEAGIEHLRILSRLSRLLRDRSFREQLMRAGAPGEIAEIFEKKENE